jgi:uncharacterized membrane protein YhaH (DUF805 family)
MSDAGPPTDQPSWLPPDPSSGGFVGADGSSTDPKMVEATKLLTRANTGAMILRLVAAVMGLVWLVTAASAFATEWHQIDASGGEGVLGTGSSTLWRLTTSVTVSGQASWGYAIAAAIALAATVWMTRLQAGDALDALDEDDDD